MQPTDQHLRVLICAPLAEAGLTMLREYAHVDEKIDLGPAELTNIIGEYDAVVVKRVATINEETLKQANRLKVIGYVEASLEVTSVQQRGLRAITYPNNAPEAAVTFARQILDIIADAPPQFKNPLSLRVVALDTVIPHEVVDPQRVVKLTGRLQTEQVLVNPPIVAPIDGQYVVLDGATRVTAFKQLGYPHIVAQVALPESGLSLNTWYHIIRQIEPAHLFQLLADLPDIHLIECSPQRVLDEMLEYGGLCYLHCPNNTAYLVRATAGANRLKALVNLTETYIAAGYITRTLNRDIISLQKEYPDLAALVVFPQYTVEHVLQIAQAGRVLPAGITRFIIPGRVLRLYADLAYLTSNRPLIEKNEWLNQLVLEKLNKGMVRYYQEPVYLLDE